MFFEILQNSLENTSARVSFLIKLHTSACNFINKETLAQVFSCEFCEISKNTFFTETSGRLLLVLTGALLRPLQLILYYQQIYFFLAYVKILSIHVFWFIQSCSFFMLGVLFLAFFVMSFTEAATGGVL